MPHISASEHTTTGNTAASLSDITAAWLSSSPDQNLHPSKQTTIPGQAFVHTTTAVTVMLVPKMYCIWQRISL